MTEQPPVIVFGPWLALLATGCSVLFPFAALEESTAERCRNGVDDDGDGLVDCRDEDCAGHCAEDTPIACTNGWDDDADGLVDVEEATCWPHMTVVTGCEGGRRRAGSTEGGAIGLAPGEPAWAFSCADPAGCAPWTLDPERGALVATLRGGPDCAGAAGGCDYALAPARSTGGPCWTLEAEVRLEPGAELAFVLAPALPVSSPLARAEDPAVVSIALRDGLFVLSYAADGRRASASVPATDGWARIRAQADGGGMDCDAERHGVLVVTLTPDGAAPVDLRGERPWLEVPRSWAVDAALELALSSAAPGTAQVRELRFEREGHDPCGYRVPQIAGEDGGPAVVLAVARGGGRICALGATTGSPHLERPYDPARDQGSPPELRDDDPPLPARTFASWHAPDRGVASFYTVEGPMRASALDGQSVRSAALAWTGARFEGVLLVSEHPRRGGRLVRAESADCERWSFEPMVGLSEELASSHPVLFDGARLVLATPSGGYALENNTTCCEDECRPLDLAACRASIGATGRENEPCDPLRVAGDTVPRIRANGNICATWPRGTLSELPVTAGGLERGPPVALPAGPEFVMSCGCGARLVAENAPSNHPVEVHQLVERGETRVLVGSGPGGIQLTLGPTSAVHVPLLAASGAPGTFDAARVAEAQLLLLGRDECTGLERGLLFYRGFERVELGPDGLVRSYGGRVGVTGVWIGTRRGPDPRCRDAGQD